MSKIPEQYRGDPEMEEQWARHVADKIRERKRTYVGHGFNNPRFQEGVALHQAQREYPEFYVDTGGPQKEYQEDQLPETVKEAIKESDAERRARKSFSFVGKKSVPWEEGPDPEFTEPPPDTDTDIAKRYLRAHNGDFFAAHRELLRDTDDPNASHSGRSPAYVYGNYMGIYDQMTRLYEDGDWQKSFSFVGKKAVNRPVVTRALNTSRQWANSQGQQTLAVNDAQRQLARAEEVNSLPPGTSDADVLDTEAAVGRDARAKNMPKPLDTPNPMDDPKTEEERRAKARHVADKIRENRKVSEGTGGGVGLNPPEGEWTTEILQRHFPGKPDLSRAVIGSVEQEMLQQYPPEVREAYNEGDVGRTRREDKLYKSFSFVGRKSHVSIPGPSSHNNADAVNRALNRNRKRRIAYTSQTARELDNKARHKSHKVGDTVRYRIVYGGEAWPVREGKIVGRGQSGYYYEVDDGDGVPRQLVRSEEILNPNNAAHHEAYFSYGKAFDESVPHEKEPDREVAKRYLRSAGGHSGRAEERVMRDTSNPNSRSFHEHTRVISNIRQLEAEGWQPEEKALKNLLIHQQKNIKILFGMMKALAQVKSEKPYHEQGRRVEVRPDNFAGNEVYDARLMREGGDGLYRAGVISGFGALDDVMEAADDEVNFRRQLGFTNVQGPYLVDPKTMMYRDNQGEGHELLDTDAEVVTQRQVAARRRKYGRKKKKHINTKSNKGKDPWVVRETFRTEAHRKYPGREHLVDDYIDQAEESFADFDVAEDWHDHPMGSHHAGLRRHLRAAGEDY